MISEDKFMFEMGNSKKKYKIDCLKILKVIFTEIFYQESLMLMSWIKFLASSSNQNYYKVFERAFSKQVDRLRKSLCTIATKVFRSYSLKVRPHYAAQPNATHCNFAAWKKLLSICHQCDRVHMEKNFFADLLQVTKTVERDR